MLIRSNKLRDLNQNVVIPRKTSPLLHISPVNSITSGVSRNKVGVLENVPQNSF